MVELIIIIVVISYVVKAKKKKGNSLPSANKPQVSRPPVRPVQNKPQMSKGPAKPIQNKTVQSKPEEMSTMEMLEAKAREDDREEMLEKQRQNIENKKHYGHLNYAEKYIIGDSVSKGKKMVFCPYCGAENLIPMYSAARDYNCYFCRENL